MDERLTLERDELDVGCIPILCSAPLLLAHARGIFEKHGLHVNLKSAPGWSGIKELMAYGKLDAAHMLSPMPLAGNLGIDGKRSELRLAAIQNVNGQALTLARKHLGIASGQDMRGFAFGVPYRFSMHYYLLCHYLAANGINPLKDVTIIEVAPPNMPYYLQQGWVDGIFAPEPYNQIPVQQSTGFIHILSKNIWDGHPCCSLATTRSFAENCPNSYRALLRSVVEAEMVLHSADPEERREIARSISAPEHLDLGDTLPAEQVLSGEFPDGKGGNHQERDRIDFVPHPFIDYGSWMLSQMQRWQQLECKIDYRQVVESAFDTDHATEIATAMGYSSSTRPRTGSMGYDGTDPFGYMSAQPFSAFREQTSREKGMELPATMDKRLEEINSDLAAVVGGNLDVSFQVAGDDELGRLEELLGELVNNSKFSRLLLQERNAELRKQSAALSRNEEGLRTTLESIGDGVIGTDTKRRITRMNREAEALTGWAEAAAIGRPLDEVFRIINEKTREPAPDPVAKVLASGGTEGLANHTLLIARNGVEKAIADSAAPIRSPSGEITGVVLVFRDQTAEREAEATILRERQTMRAVLDGIDDVIYVSDPETHELLHVNEAFKKTWPGESVGKKCYAVLQNREAPCPFCTNDRIFGENAGKSYIWEFRNEVTGNWYRCSDKAIRWIDGALVRFELASDITALKTAELALQEANAKLESSNRELEQFAYVASHDLQEPLRMVASYTELLAQRYTGQLDEKADKYIRYAIDGAKRMQGLITDLLTFSRVGKTAGSLKPTDCNLLLGEILQGLERAIEESGATIDAGPLPVVLADRSQLAQVFQNLIGNAIKFRGDKPPIVKITATRQDKRWSVAVADNGIGFDPEFTERIFTIFQRLHRRGEYAGTGIGLAIVKKIVERHGGRIDVHSTPGEGSTFTFSLPAAKDTRRDDLD